MALKIAKEVAVMRRMTGRELRQMYEKVFGEACRSHDREWLIKRIAWRLQTNAEGNLSERARRRAGERAGVKAVDGWLRFGVANQDVCLAVMRQRFHFRSLLPYHRTTDKR